MGERKTINFTNSFMEYIREKKCKDTAPEEI